MRNIQKIRDWQNNHKKLGLCIECNNETFGKLRCEDCNKRRGINVIKYRKERKEKGLCPTCGNNVIIGKNLCLKHYLKQTSSCRLLTRSLDKQLEQLMIKQNFKCALTGDSISWGNDIELDHIIPTSKGGSNTLDNVQWTTKEANRLKQDMTINELKIICNKVVNNLVAEIRAT